MNKNILFGCASIVACVGVATAACAREDASASQPVPPQGGGLEDIVVTAQKVETTLQRTPLTIQTFTGEDLVKAGVMSAEGLNKLVPGLAVENSGGGASSIFIRGIGTRVLNAFGDPGNAFAVDGVYYGRPAGPNATFFDIARVEVVKGPQGTLYGRNATGGGVNVITNRPGPDFGVEGSLEYGSYDLMRGSGAVNLPLADGVALRLAGQIIRRDGYMDDGYDDEKMQAARASLLLSPGDRVSLLITADYAHNGGQGFATTPMGPGTALSTRFVGDPRQGPSGAAVSDYIDRATGAINAPNVIAVIPGNPPTILCRATQPPGVPVAVVSCPNPLGVDHVNRGGFVDNEYYGLNFTADMDLDFATWTTIAGYRGTKTDTRFHIGPTPQASRTGVDQLSLETRLASSGTGPFKWIAGAYYLVEDQSFHGQFSSENLATTGQCVSPVVNGGCTATVTSVQDRFTLELPNVKNETYAFFGQATLSLADPFRITGGIRYTKETKESVGGVSRQYYLINRTAPPPAPMVLETSYPSQGRVSFDNVSWRAGIEYDVAARSMFYANIATGYHAGGINLGTPDGPNRYDYDPEKVTAYTVGLKNRFLDNRLQFNIEGFWLDYRNLQIQGLGRINSGAALCSAVPGSCPIALRTDNAAKARIRGVEADLQWNVTPGGTLSATIAYTDSEYRRFRIAGLSGAISDYSGVSLSGVSKWNITAAYNQRFEMASGGAIVAEVRSNFRNDTWMWYIRHPGNFQPAYTRTDLSLGYEAADGEWSITGYVRNIENKDTILQGFNPNAETGVPWNTLNPPRTFGVIGSFKF